MSTTLSIDRRIAQYEGLVFKTATLIEGRVAEDLDEIRQLLRIKIWKALLAYDPTRSRQPENRYVFSCLLNQKKDLLKRKRRPESYIEDVAPTITRGQHGGDNASGFTYRDRFEDRYLSAAHDDVFGHVEKDDFQLPSTLNDFEVSVVLLLYADPDRIQREVAAELGVTKWRVESALESIRMKLADWKPSAPPVRELAVAA